MNILILKDKKIGNAEVGSVISEVSHIYEERCDIIPTVHYENMDYSELPFEVYYSDNFGISKAYIKRKAKDIYKRWAEEIDLVIFLVHENNWKAGRIWGWNLSNIYSGYEVEQCRWDKDKAANSVGTMYHEIMHSHDSFIYRYLGIWVHPLLRVGSWDVDIVHGRSPSYEYIRHKENQDALQYIAPFLRQAFAKRRKIFEKHVSVLRQILNKAEQVLELQRRVLAKLKKGDLPLFEDNKCI